MTTPNYCKTINDYVVNKGVKIDFPNESTILDSFGRMRVSQIEPLIDIKHQEDKRPELIDEELIGTGLSTYSATNSSVLMSTSANNDVVIRQTFQRLPYYAGKSQILQFTVSNFVNETNITKRIGGFSSNTTTPFNSTLDGIFFESSDDYYLVVMKSGTEIQRVARRQWTDPMDGNGDSQINLDFTKSQILLIDFQYLGVGIIRFMVSVMGRSLILLIYHHENNGTSTYMTHCNQPLRYEIRQTGVGSGSMEMICCAAGTEGTTHDVGLENSINMEITQVDADSTVNTYALCGIQLNSIVAHIHIQTISVLAVTNDNFLWSLRRNPTIAGTFTYSAYNSRVNTAVGSGNTNIVTGGDILLSGYANARSATTITNETFMHLGIAIDGTLDEIVLCVRSLTNTADILGSISWIEAA